jgi:nicotinamide-nucleotide amidase
MRKINRFVKYLQEKSLTVAFAESVTCGMASQNLSIYNGTTDVFKGSIICYTPEVKTGCLRVPVKLIEQYTTESMQVTEALAKNLGHLISADIHAAITGLAAPGGSETRSKPVGTIFLCFFYRGRSYKRKVRFYGSATEIRKKACLEMYEFILSKV